MILDKLFFLRTAVRIKMETSSEESQALKLLRHNSVYFSHFSAFAKLFAYNIIHNCNKILPCVVKFSGKNIPSFNALQVDVRGTQDNIEKVDGKHSGYKNRRVAKTKQIKQTLK